MTPKLLTALKMNGEAIPRGPMIAPARAGPTARLTLNPTLLAETALGSSSLGTRLGTTACHPGEVNTPQTLIRNINQRSEAGVTQLNHTYAAKMPESTAVTLSPQISKRRLSKMSVSAPATSARRKNGALLAT